ncbi:NAD-P-binding protein [Artomyces pyxidatus]|uniref:NAD-P-binding protein n=1 Tax=Artomyces pyxidatus TaxID=48021 RepID=A0ACB8T3Y3_9AGAM|nr:NAD-P-binding protein [Artomyces pyxidatus]
MLPLPETTKAITVHKSTRKPTYHDVKIETKPIRSLSDGEVLVKITAAGFNRRELWTRLGQYPGIVFGATLGADGAGIVVASAKPGDELVNKRVFLVPTRGWEKHPLAPEAAQAFGIVGGGRLPPIGTFTEYVVVERDQVVLTPEYLDDVHAAAWPVGGVTAWRAAVVNARVEKGHNVLITGIGGGVAVLAMQICLARGANVYVTSGKESKLSQAKRLGATGGVNYKQADWPSQLANLLKTNGHAHLDAVIDSAGGDIALQTGKILKPGGRIVCYGATAGPKITFTMREILKNQQLIGSTMGSHQDLIDATRFLADHHIVPVVSHILNGLSAAEEGFELLKTGDQFGKIVIKVDSAPPQAKL